MTAEAEGSELLDRLQRYSRYVAIVAGQLDALDRGDHDRVLVLMGERRLLEPECSLEGGGWDSDSMPPSLQEALVSGLSELERRFEMDRSLEDHWISIRDGALRSARSLALRSLPPVGRYAAADSCGERLDLRL